MKRLRNEFFKHVHYLCLVGVIALGLMTIVATTGGNGGNGGGGGGGAAASSGTLDLTWAVIGFVIHSNAAGGIVPGMNTDAGNFITTGPIFVTGISTNAAPDQDMVVWNYNANGTLNGTFGGTGFVVFDSLFGFDFGFSITIDAMGRILVTGASAFAAGQNMTVWRFNPNGTLDGTFGVGGIFNITGTAGGPLFDQGNGITIDAMGRILVTGFSVNAALDIDMVTWRLTPAGLLDGTFGPGGTGFFVHSNAAGGIIPGMNNDLGASITIDAMGRILVTGNSTNAANDTDMVTWRLTPAGVLDPTFGPGGTGFFVHSNAAGGIIPGMNTDAGFNITIGAMARILVTGISTNAAGDSDMVVWRLTPAGLLDPTFGPGGTGFVVFDGGGGIGGDAGNSITIDAMARILVAGFITNAKAVPDTDMAVWRFNPAGTLDTTFNPAGVIPGIFVHDNAAGGNGADAGRSITIRANGNILVTGISTNAAGDTDKAIWGIIGNNP